jgi:hypothetical protein
MPARAMVNIFDGTRQSYADTPKLLITCIDGNRTVQSRKFHKKSSVLFSALPTFDNFGDDYSILASADGYKDAGFMPVRMTPESIQVVNLMLLPDENNFNFSGAAWKILSPRIKSILAADLNDAPAAARYNDLKDLQDGEVLACLLNILTAMDQIMLPQGTPLQYLKALIWDSSMASDRFFGWADPAILPQLDQAKTHGTFVGATPLLHSGATRSYKQIQFGEANVQLTFHEQDRKTIAGLNCIRIEPDIDYFRDPAAHMLLEVALNAFGSMTDPRSVYALRWIAGQRAGIPEFDPLYTIEKA